MQFWCAYELPRLHSCPLYPHTTPVGDFHASSNFLNSSANDLTSTRYPPIQVSSNPARFLKLSCKFVGHVGVPAAALKPCKFSAFCFARAYTYRYVYVCTYMYMYMCVYAHRPNIYLESCIWPGLCRHRNIWQLSHLVQTIPTGGLIISLAIVVFAIIISKTTWPNANDDYNCCNIISNIGLHRYWY